MNLYLDTSALVKLYVAEAGSTAVRRRCRGAALVATSQVAYPEARAALARRMREGGLTLLGLRRAVSDLDNDWPRFVVVALDGALARQAGELAERRALRGFDAIHLASALECGLLFGTAPAFLCFDARLAAAAADEGLPA